jgi:hypothetical protein
VKLQNNTELMRACLEGVGDGIQQRRAPREQTKDAFDTGLQIEQKVSDSGHRRAAGGGDLQSGHDSQRR